MSKLKTNDVRYIVLEGGGARGAAYLGAIKGLQREFDRTKGAPGSTFELAQGVAEKGENNALLDYVSCNDGKLKILGVAGSSAGAITSYALALGLNAKDIEEYVMKFEFKNFLSVEQEIPGKFRMIDKEGQLMIGDDAKRNVGGKLKGPKVVGLKKEQFRFNLSKDETVVYPNPQKKEVRSGVAMLAVKIILDGVVTNLERFTFWLRSFWPFGRGNFGNLAVNRNRRMTNELFQGMTTTTLAVNLPLIINKKYGNVLPFKLSYEGITNLLFDSGIYSGFKVREFFYDITLFAATRDTHFRRSLIKAVNNKEILKSEMGNTDITASDLDFKDFKIGKRSETIFPDEIQPILNYLQNLTFTEFYQLTGVEFAICVSNLTSNLPLYFSHKWTPDFQVQEAVGASMTIPPAIKPLYNESDVYKITKDKSVRVKVWGADAGQPFEHRFVDVNGNFSTADYYRYEHVMKKALQDKLKERNLWISTNNVTDISTFLPLLRELVIGEYDESSKQYKVLENKNHTVVVEGITYSFGKELFDFYYNATYYGLFVDGGYRCNIPYNIFRKMDYETTEPLKQTLAIKLDGNFPAVLTSRLMSELAGFGPLETNIRNFLNAKEVVNSGAIPESLKPLTDLLMPVLNALLEGASVDIDTPSVDSIKPLNAEQFLFKARKILIDYYRGQVNDDLLNRLGKSNPAIDQLMKSLMKTYNAGMKSKPWEVRQGISVPMSEGYSYGSELGQLRFMSDHNYIIPLYSCGIGIYDFDLEKIRVLADLSKEVSERAIEAYFN